MGLLSQGQTNPQIAQNLTVSRGTVKIHVQHIISKLGVSDRTQAAVRAIEAGFDRHARLADSSISASQHFSISGIGLVVPCGFLRDRVRNAGGYDAYALPFVIPAEAGIHP